MTDASAQQVERRLSGVLEYRRHLRFASITQTITIVMLVIALLFISRLSSDTNTTVHYIQDQTSPAHLSKQQADIKAYLLILNCQDRVAAEDAVNGLVALIVKQGLIKPGQVRISDNCAKPPHG